MKLSDINTDNSNKKLHSTSFVHREVRRTLRNFLVSNFVILISLAYICFKFETFNGLFVAFVSLILANLYYFFEMKNNFRIHPLIFELSKYGLCNDVVDEIQKEFEMGHRNIGPMLLTQNWLFLRGFFKTEVIHLDDLIWAYSKVTTHKTNFIVTGKTFELILNNRHNFRISYQLKENEINEIMLELQGKFPWVLLGYSDKLNTMWFENNQTMTELVLVKRKLTVPNKPLKSFFAVEKMPFFAKFRFRVGASLILGCLISYMNTTPLEDKGVQMIDSMGKTKPEKVYISPLVKEFSRKLTLTDEAQKVFRNSNPDFITDKLLLNKHCGNSHQVGYKDRILYGCYDGQKIYILNVKDKKFLGVVEVTTSHELLHAVYHDMSLSYRKEVDALVLEEYKKIKNRDILNRLKLYEESQTLSELHSILGTEIVNLPPKLEAHYAKYFRDRSEILKFHKKSNQLTNDFKFNLAQFDKKLKSERKELLDLRKLIEKQKISLLKLEKEIKSFRLSSPFNKVDNQKLLDNYEKRVVSLNSLISSLGEKGKDYNSLIKKRNRLVKEHQNQVADVFIPKKHKAKSKI